MILKNKTLQKTKTARSTSARRSSSRSLRSPFPTFSGPRPTLCRRCTTEFGSTSRSTSAPRYCRRASTRCRGSWSWRGRRKTRGIRRGWVSHFFPLCFFLFVPCSRGAWFAHSHKKNPPQKTECDPEYTVILLIFIEIIIGCLTIMSGHAP